MNHLHNPSQSMQALERQLHDKEQEGCELKLEILRWRKQSAVLRLKQSSLEETVHGLQTHIDINAVRGS